MSGFEPNPKRKTNELRFSDCELRTCSQRASMASKMTNRIALTDHSKCSDSTNFVLFMDFGIRWPPRCFTSVAAVLQSPLFASRSVFWQTKFSSHRIASIRCISPSATFPYRTYRADVWISSLLPARN